MVYFSLLTFMAQKREEDTIYVMTDAPQYYKRLASCITIIPLTQQQIDEWQGQHRFFWRAKIKAIEKVIMTGETQPVIYLDGDTYLHGNINNIRNILTEGHALMHVNEGHPSKMKTKTLRMWETIKGRVYHNVTIGMEHDMWNAGVVALPADKQKEAIQMALDVCDGMLDDNAEPIVVEQYSLSIALYETFGLKPAIDTIGHYWGNKPEWLNFISEYMQTSFVMDLTIEEEVERLRKEINLKAIPYYKHYSHWRDILQKRLNRWKASIVKTY